MRTSLRKNIVRPLILGSLILPIASAAFAKAPPPADLKPNAEGSLLLDVDQAGEQLVAVGERGHILISKDGGNTWEQVASPIREMITAVDFADGQTGWAVAHDGHILVTRDGGNTWDLQLNGIENQKVLNEQRLIAAQAELARLEQLLAEKAEAEANGEVFDEEPYLVVDAYGESLTLEDQFDEAEWQAGNAEEKLHGKVIAPPLMDVWFSDTRKGWAVGAFGALLATVDGGITWKDMSTQINNPDGYHLNSVLGVGDTVIIAGEAGLLFYSHDAGKTWSAGDLGYDGTIFTLVTNGKKFVASGLRGNTFVSEDMGVTWTAISTNVDYSMAGGDFDDEVLVLAGTAGWITYSLDGGVTFKQHTLASRSSLVGVMLLDGNKLLIVGQGGVHHFDLNSTNQ